MSAATLQKRPVWPVVARSLIVGAVLIVGLAAGANAIANIAADRAPDVALEFWHAHSVALVNKAEAQLGLDRRDEARRLARETVRSTALSSEAFQVLGMTAVTTPEEDPARPLLEYASRLSRRETPTQIWLLQQELLTGNVESALRRLDGVMRVSEQSRSALFPLLASAIATDGLVAPALDIFEREPAWLLGFMRYAIGNGSALPNLAQIVVALPQDSLARTPGMQAALVDAMVVEGRYSEGRKFLNAVAPASTDGPVRDPSFRTRGTYEPFDWHYTEEPGLRAFLSGGSTGGLRYSAGTGKGGRVARQLIALEPGLHRLIVSGNIESRNSGGVAAWHVRCASDLTLELAQLPMPTGEIRSVATTFTVPADDCDVQWLELVVEATFSPGGIQGEVEMARVKPVSAGQRE